MPRFISSYAILTSALAFGLPGRCSAQTLFGLIPGAMVSQTRALIAVAHTIVTNINTMCLTGSPKTGVAYA